MIEKSVVTKFEFVTTISHMVKDKSIIWIPRRYHPQIAKSLDKPVRVQIDDDEL
jgi:hypothetical protein